jgi:hypothetical protein
MILAMAADGFADRTGYGSRGQGFTYGQLLDLARQSATFGHNPQRHRADQGERRAFVVHAVVQTLDVQTLDVQTLDVPRCQAPVPVFRIGSGSCVPVVAGVSGGVAAGGSAAGVGEGAVLA